jgi:cytochrome c-type biogenesis protein CcmH
MKGLAILLLIGWAAAAQADSTMAADPLANTQLPDARQEAQAKALMENLRCVVCQGQSIADSDAELAGDMRAMVRRRIAAGESPGAIRDWMVARYGDWISFRPPVEPLTWPLWAAPILFVAAGLWLARGRFKPSRK